MVFDQTKLLCQEWFLALVFHHLKRLAHYGNEQVHEYHEHYESSQDKKYPRELVVWA